MPSRNQLDPHGAVAAAALGIGAYALFNQHTAGFSNISAEPQGAWHGHTLFGSLAASAVIVTISVGVAALTGEWWLVWGALFISLLGTTALEVANRRGGTESMEVDNENA